MGGAIVEGGPAGTGRAATVWTPELTTALMALIGRLPAYASLCRRLLRDGELDPRGRAVALAALAYTASPIDLVPDFIPKLGQMDDLAITLLGVRAILGPKSRAVAEGHLATAGLSSAQLEADLATLGRVGSTLGRRALRLGAAAALVGLRGLAGAIGRARGRRASD